MILDFVNLTLFSCAFGTLALYLLIIGFRGLVTKKPFFVSDRWLAVPELVLVAFCFRAWMPKAGANIADTLDILNWLPLVPILILILLYVWKFITCREYGAFAFTNESFQEAIQAALKKMDLPYVRASDGIHLPTPATIIRITEVSRRWGSATLRVEKLRFRPVLRGIVTYMEEACVDAPRSAVNLRGCAWYAIFGILTLIGLGAFLVFLS